MENVRGSYRKTLKKSEAELWLLLYSWGGFDNGIGISYNALSSSTGLKNPQIVRTIKSLRDKGMLSIISPPKKELRQLETNLYHLLINHELIENTMKVMENNTQKAAKNTIKKTHPPINRKSTKNTIKSNGYGDRWDDNRKLLVPARGRYIYFIYNFYKSNINKPVFSNFHKEVKLPYKKILKYKAYNKPSACCKGGFMISNKKLRRRKASVLPKKYGTSIQEFPIKPEALQSTSELTKSKRTTIPAKDHYILLPREKHRHITNPLSEEDFNNIRYKKPKLPQVTNNMALVIEYWEAQGFKMPGKGTKTYLLCLKSLRKSLKKYAVEQIQDSIFKFSLMALDSGFKPANPSMKKQLANMYLHQFISNPYARQVKSYLEFCLEKAPEDVKSIEIAPNTFPKVTSFIQSFFRRKVIGGLVEDKEISSIDYNNFCKAANRLDIFRKKYEGNFGLVGTDTLELAEYLCKAIYENAGDKAKITSWWFCSDIAFKNTLPAYLVSKGLVEEPDEDDEEIDYESTSYDEGRGDHFDKYQNIDKDDEDLEENYVPYKFSKTLN